MTKPNNDPAARTKQARQARRAGGSLRRPFLFCALATVLLLLLFGSYTKNLQRLVDDESSRYLEEIAAQVSVNLKDKLNYHYSVLNTFARAVERNTECSMPELLALLEPERASYGYRAIALIDQDGALHTQAGARLYPELLPYIATMKREQRSMTSGVMDIFGADCSAFMTPLSALVVDGITIQGVLVATDMGALTDSLSLSMFNHQGFAHVITPSGSVVLRAANKNNQFESYNLLTYLGASTSLEGITLEELRENLREGKSGRISFRQADGMEMSAFYTPADYETWYLFAVIPSDVLTMRTNAFYSQTIWALSLLTAIFMLLLIIIMFSQRQKKRELLQTLHTDPVTGGDSMRKFELDVSEALRGREKEYALLYANVEKFKLINEQLGRVSADRLLCHIHQVIQGELNKKAGESVSRLMADHFGILLHTQELSVIQSRVQSWDVKIKQDALNTHASIPIRMAYGVLPVDSLEDVAVLLDRANMARKLAEARNDGGPRLACYDESLKNKILLEQELESRQDAALASGEFKMYLQPKYDPKSNAIAGAEALVRWLSPEKGLLFPDQYIPLFESNGFIVRLDLFIFEEACRFIDSYLKSGGQPVPISVNLSRINLNDPNFVEHFAAIWAKYQFDSALLEFEITESLIFDNMELLEQTIATLHQHGFRVSMDDFGSGYSSLNMLKNVDIDVIKLDRQFFIGREDDAYKGKRIVSTMIHLCKELGIDIVAEGVETQEQVDFLRQQDCDLIQGYYYAKPMPQEQFLEKLKRESREMV